MPITEHLPTVDTLMRLVAAVLVGFAIGIEREYRDKPAGIRTMILICLGSCVFTLVSERIGGPNVDRSRIAAQIVSGVGFLGAGAILRDARSVYGLTTAATIWVVAALGMACGFGMYDFAIGGTCMAIIVLIFLHAMVLSVAGRRHVCRYRLADAGRKFTFAGLDKLFEESGLHVVKRNCFEDGNVAIYTVRVVGPIDKHVAIRELLLRHHDLKLVR